MTSRWKGGGLLASWTRVAATFALAMGAGGTLLFSIPLLLGGPAMAAPEPRVEHALRMGRVAKVERVIYGHYVLDADRITISIFVLDMGKQEVIQREELTGRVRDLRPLVRKLVFQFASHQRIELSEAERANIQF